jgi:hypothetical protein
MGSQPICRSAEMTSMHWLTHAAGLCTTRACMNWCKTWMHAAYSTSGSRTPTLKMHSN